MEMDSRYTPEMLAAIVQAYPRAEPRGPYLIRYPPKT
jgi:hypothetical protein